MDDSYEYGKTLSVGRSIKFAWHQLLKNKLFFILTWVIVVLLAVPLWLHSATFGFPKYGMYLGVGLAFLSGLVLLGVIPGVLNCLVAIYNGERPDIGDVFRRFTHAFRFFLTFVLYSLIVFTLPLLFGYFAHKWWMGTLGFSFPSAWLGWGVFGLLGLFVLFITIYLATRYIYAFWAVSSEENMGVVRSLSYSASLSKGAKWDIFALGIMSCLLIVAGFAFFGFGSLITMPLVWLAATYSYVQLRGQTNA